MRVRAFITGQITPEGPIWRALIDREGVEEEWNGHRRAGEIGRVYRLRVAPIQPGHSGKFDLCLSGDIRSDHDQIPTLVLLGQLRIGARRSQFQSWGNGAQLPKKIFRRLDSDSFQLRDQPIQKGFPRVQAQIFLQVVDNLRGLPDQFDHAGLIQDRL